MVEIFVNGDSQTIWFSFCCTYCSEKVGSLSIQFITEDVKFQAFSLVLKEYKGIQHNMPT